ncbi:hypothetical protein [Streptomyces sp. NPDC037389]|uniref:hypothetical protein n=1 Tax=Streptomyces sp. NPDC037389 TaxID=3155369 RepID=UPI0034077983
MGELQTFGEGISPETRALAQALRDLFAGLEISERRYAARRSYDSSTVSRYLSGQRLPPWEFALNLLNDVAEKRGTVPTPEMTEMLRALHHAALRAGKSPTHKVQLLQQQLAVADEDARRAAQRERWLEDTLRDREHRVRELQLQIGGLRSDSDMGVTDADRARLIAEIRQLKEELEETREAHRQAEERCERLERQLADAEMRAGPASELVAAGLIPPGTQTVFNGHVYVNRPDRWAIDEAYVGLLTVWFAALDKERRAQVVHNGLVIDERTVVVPHTWSADDGVDRLYVSRDGVREGFVRASVLEYGSDPFNLAVLRLDAPLPDDVPPFRLGSQPPPATRLLVNGFAYEHGRTLDLYSCLIEVKGQSGPWVRVEGELARGLNGAPAFHVGTGELVGLVGQHLNDEKTKAHLIPAGALLDFESLTPRTTA